MQYVFANWSDSGAVSHVITVPRFQCYLRREFHNAVLSHHLRERGRKHFPGKRMAERRHGPGERHARRGVHVHRIRRGAERRHYAADAHTEQCGYGNGQFRRTAHHDDLDLSSWALGDSRWLQRRVQPLLLVPVGAGKPALDRGVHPARHDWHTLALGQLVGWRRGIARRYRQFVRGWLHR